MIDRITDNLEQYMNGISFRQKLVASNIANADTPGYKTQDADFRGDLLSAMEVDGLPTKQDGNNVDLDREARLLSENAMRFSIASNLMRSHFTAIRAAIQGGK